MIKKIIPKSLIAAIAATVSVAIENPAHAYIVLFGEDLGLGENVRLTAFPQANDAREDFLSILTGASTETFESFPPNSSAPLSLNFSNVGSAVLTGNGIINNIPTGTNGVGRYPISGDQFLETNGQFSIDFSQPVAAFGFFGVDIGDFRGQLILTLMDGSTTTLTVPNSVNAPGGSVLFYSFIAENPSELFTQVTFGNTAPGTDFFGFDDVTVATVEQVKRVPENTSALGLLAFAGLGGVLLKKRKQQLSC